MLCLTTHFPNEMSYNIGGRSLKSRSYKWIKNTCDTMYYKVIWQSFHWTKINLNMGLWLSMFLIHVSIISVVYVHLFQQRKSMKAHVLQPSPEWPIQVCPSLYIWSDKSSIHHPMNIYGQFGFKPMRDLIIPIYQYSTNQSCPYLD